MHPLTLLIKDVDTLNIVQQKLSRQQLLTDQERECLIHLLNNLPSTAMLLVERLQFDEKIVIETLDLRFISEDIDKWLHLFNKLPKLGGHYPIALFSDADEHAFYWKDNVIIEVSFIPSYRASQKQDQNDKSICLCLRIDGTAYFVIKSLQLAEIHGELYSFNGNWREAYLLLVKTLKQGWPQASFPKEFEQFLKK